MAVTHPYLRTVEGQLTTAEVNAGVVVVPGQLHRQLTVVDGWVRAIGGNASANTSVDVVDSVTGTVAIAFEVAGLTQNTVLRMGAANTTNTNVLAALGVGEGLKVVNNGTAMATATALDYHIDYVVTEAYLT
jgi:hypothetical protein